MTCGSLFAGVGGFDLGFERAGMQCLWQIEIDPHCRMVLRKRFDAEIRNDVKEAGKRNLQPVRVICAGVPCQDVSVAGRRAGLAGSRTGLFFEFERIVSELQPEWFVFENVPGLLSSNERRDFATVIGRLGQCGYLQAYRVLNSQYWGVAQRRRRVFIVGHLRGTGAIEVLFESEGVPWNPQKGEEAGESVARGLTKGLGSGGADAAHVQAEWLVPDSINERSMPLDGRQGSAVAVTERTRKDGRSLETQEELAYALTNPGGGGRSHSRQIAGLFGVRRLTPRECERLQGFPDDWTRYGIDENGKEVDLSDTQRYRQMGNAVTVPVAEWIGKRIVQTMRS